MGYIRQTGLVAHQLIPRLKNWRLYLPILREMGEKQVVLVNPTHSRHIFQPKVVASHTGAPLITVQLTRLP